MKAFTLVFTAFLLVSISSAFAQGKTNVHKQNDRRTDTENNTTHNDTTAGSGSFNALSGTPGPATTSGTGGLGTIDHRGRNTSSDIYNIERRDSIHEAKERMKQDSIQKAKGDRNRAK